MTASKLSFSYVITNDENPFGVVGYRADVAVYPSSENDSSCFCTWIASWEEANDGIAGLPAMILGKIKSAEKAAAGKASL